MTQSSSFSRDYEVLDEIGRGRFGVVFTCKSRATGELFAVKSVDKYLVSGDSIDQQSLTNEPKALLLLSSSSHVTRLHTFYDSHSHLHLILDLFPHPSLFSFLSLHHRLPEPEARLIAANLLHALLHCHKSGVVHRDIKPENILVDPQTKTVRLCDFGSAGFQSPETSMTEVVGTPYYVAPEVLKGTGYCEKVDVWSAGVVLYEMVAGIPPFDGERVEDIFEKVMRGNLRFPAKVFGSVSVGVKDLLRKMLCKDVSRRFSADEALRHSWIVNGEPLQKSNLN